MTVHVDQHGNVVQASRPALAQNLSFAGSSVQSVAFQTGQPVNAYAPDGTLMTQPNNTTHIRVCSNSNCWISFGANPTAVASGAASILIPAYTPEYFWVVRGERIAVIQDSAAGVLNVAELAQ